MRALLWLVMVFAALWPGVSSAEVKGVATVASLPTVEVYEIRKSGADGVKRPETILEIANATGRTYFIRGGVVNAPEFHMEVLRGGKWLTAYWPDCGTGVMCHALRPGAKVLVSVTPTWTEEASRFRFFFYTRGDLRDGDVVSVRSRAIERKELGEDRGEERLIYRPEEYHVPVTDEAMNAQREQSREEEMKATVEKAKRAQEAMRNLKEGKPVEKKVENPNGGFVMPEE